MAAIAETVWQYQQQYESALDAFFEFKATGKVASVRVESGHSEKERGSIRHAGNFSNEILNNFGAEDKVEVFRDSTRAGCYRAIVVLNWHFKFF